MKPIHFLQKLGFALLYAYGSYWNNWVKEVENEYELMQRRNVLKRRH